MDQKIERVKKVLSGNEDFAACELSSEEVEAVCGGNPLAAGIVVGMAAGVAAAYYFA